MDETVQAGADEEDVIITRTPLRISLVGGGTDMPGFFTRDYGAVVSFTIDKYIYISVNRQFDERIRVSYSKTENVKSANDVQHDIAREMLKHYGVDGVEITSVSDVPGEGSGLGSSSAYAVGLSLALRGYKGWSTDQHPTLHAETAYEVEREKCGHFVGMQDHYAAAFGGLRYYQFNSEAGVAVEELYLKKEGIEFLENSLMLFYTGQTRKAGVVLRDQEENLARGEGAWIAGTHLRDLAVKLRDELRQGTVENLGGILHEAWRSKKRLSGGVSAGWIDELYDRATKAGALGGKICGAGGGGFMMFVVEEGKQKDVELSVGLRRVPFKLEPLGSCVIYNGGSDE